MQDIVRKSAKEINKLFLEKQISAKEIVDAFYKQIEIVEPKIQALNVLTKELAYKQAEELDKKIQKSSKLGPMAGVPIIIKNVLCVKD